MNRIKNIGLVLICSIAGNMNGQAVGEEIMQEVVVSARKMDLPAKKVTQSVSIITGEEIRDQQVTDLHEVLRDIPGFSVVQSGSRGGSASIFSRGGSANHNLVLIDGVRVNNIGGGFDFSELPTDNIERIEVLKFPQSALYGSDAMGALIHIITKKGKGPARFDFTAAGGNFGTFEERASLSGGTEKGGYSFGASRIDTEGILTINNRFSETSFSGRFDQKLHDRVQLTLNSRYVDADFAFPTAGSGNRFLTVPDPRQNSKRKKLTLGANVKSDVFSWWDQQLQLGLNEEGRIFSDPLDPLVDFSATQTQTVETRQSVDYLWNMTLPEAKGLDTIVTAGVAYEKEFFDQASAGSTSLVQDRKNSAYYFQSQWSWRDLIFFSPGVRIEDNQFFTTDANPRYTGGFFLPWTQSKIRGSWGRGITAPSFFQLFASGFVDGNPNLKPEKVESWEVGLDQSLFEDLITVSFTYYESIYSDLIGFISSVGPDFFNIQSARTSGVESSVKLRKRWMEKIDASLALTHAYLETKTINSGGAGGTTFITGQPLVRRPKHSGSVTANVSHLRFNANVNVTVQGKRIDSDFSQTPSVRVTLPPYAKTDFAASVIPCPRMPGFRVFAKVENLLDAQYEEVFGFTTAGIKFLGGIGIQFK